jgi:hypothetical protein
VAPHRKQEVRAAPQKKSRCSFLVPTDLLTVYSSNGTTWSPFPAPDLSYDGTYANFTISGFSGYAVVAIPEPSSIALLLLGAPAFLRRRRRPPHSQLLSS